MRNGAIAFFGHVSDSWSHIYIWNKCERIFEMTKNRRHIHDNHILMVIQSTSFIHDSVWRFQPYRMN